MLRATDEERDAITDYYLGQSPEGTEVRFLQKVYSEAVLGHGTTSGTSMRATAAGGSSPTRRTSTRRINSRTWTWR